VDTVVTPPPIPGVPASGRLNDSCSNDTSTASADGGDRSIMTCRTQLPDALGLSAGRLDDGDQGITASALRRDNARRP
jgi:hypothetical protein